MNYFVYLKKKKWKKSFLFLGTAENWFSKREVGRKEDKEKDQQTNNLSGWVFRRIKTDSEKSIQIGHCLSSMVTKLYVLSRKKKVKLINFFA